MFSWRDQVLRILCLIFLTAKSKKLVYFLMHICQSHFLYILLLQERHLCFYKCTAAYREYECQNV